MADELALEVFLNFNSEDCEPNLENEAIITVELPNYIKPPSSCTEQNRETIIGLEILHVAINYFANVPNTKYIVTKHDCNGVKESFTRVLSAGCYSLKMLLNDINLMGGIDLFNLLPYNNVGSRGAEDRIKLVSRAPGSNSEIDTVTFPRYLCEQLGLIPTQLGIKQQNEDDVMFLISTLPTVMETAD